MQRLSLEQRALILADFDTIADNLELVIAEFYRRLFETAPDVRGLFSADPGGQYEKMLRSLEFLIEALDRPQTLRDYALELGNVHVNLGMTSEHFRLFVPTFIAAVQAYSSDWNPQQETAWQFFLEDVSNLMGFAISD